MVRPSELALRANPSNGSLVVGASVTFGGSSERTSCPPTSVLCGVPFLSPEDDPVKQSETDLTIVISETGH